MSVDVWLVGQHSLVANNYKGSKGERDEPKLPHYFYIILFTYSWYSITITITIVADIKECITIMNNDNGRVRNDVNNIEVLEG